MAKKGQRQRRQTDAARHMDNQPLTVRLPWQVAPPTDATFVGLTEGLPRGGRSAVIIDEQADPSPFYQLRHAPPPALPDIPDLDLLQAADVIEQAGQPQVADLLRKLPPGPQKCREVGGPHHLQVVFDNGQPSIIPRMEDLTGTHHYVLKTATFHGLALRWYEWEERPKVDPEKSRDMGHTQMSMASALARHGARVDIDRLLQLEDVHVLMDNIDLLRPYMTTEQIIQANRRRLELLGLPGDLVT